MCYKAENVDLSFIFFLLFLNWYLLYAFHRSYDRSHPVADLIKCSNFLVFSKTIHRLWSRSNSGGVLSIIFFIYAFIYSLFVVVVMEYWTLARALHHQWPSHHTTYSSPLCSTSKHWRLVVRWESSYIGYIFFCWLCLPYETLVAYLRRLTEVKLCRKVLPPTALTTLSFCNKSMLASLG